MSFGIPGLGSLVNKFVDAVGPSVISALVPGSALIPGLNNMIADKIGDMLGNAVDEAMKQAKFPSFQIKDVLNLLKDCVQNQKQPCDRGCADEAKDRFGDITDKMIDDMICDFRDMFKKYMNECAKEGKGKGGCGKGGGAEGGGAVGIRELAALVAELETKAADNLKKKVTAAADSLSETTSGKEEDKAKDAQIRKNQFLAQEEAKAEGTIFQVTASTSSGVLKAFSDGLNAIANK